jgi:hypothetical protein
MNDTRQIEADIISELLKVDETFSELLKVVDDTQSNDDDNLDSLLQSPDVQNKLREVKENAEEITR